MITISSDKSRLQVNMIHAFLTQAYWSEGRTIEQVEKSIEHSLCFGVYIEDKQIGFARIVTDYTVFSYLMDVFILPEYRGKGYSKELMKNIVNDAALKTCRVWMLKTSDAQDFYKKFDYRALRHSEKVMERILK